MAYSRDGRWRTDSYISRSSDSYFESDTHYQHRVLNLATGQVFAEYPESHCGNANGWQYSGVRFVEFSPDGRELLLHWHDEPETRRVPLPEEDRAERELRARHPVLVSPDGIWAIVWREPLACELHEGEEDAVRRRFAGVREVTFAFGRRLRVVHTDGRVELQRLPK